MGCLARECGGEYPQRFCFSGFLWDVLDDHESDDGNDDGLFIMELFDPLVVCI